MWIDENHFTPVDRWFIPVFKSNFVHPNWCEGDFPAINLPSNQWFGLAVWRSSWRLEIQDQEFKSPEQSKPLGISRAFALNQHWKIATRCWGALIKRKHHGLYHVSPTDREVW